MYIYTHNLLQLSCGPRRVNSLETEMEAERFSENLADIYYLKWPHIVE